LAHPDEPQRALGAAPWAPLPAAGELAAHADPDSRRAIGVVLACFATALVALLAGYLYLTIPGAWFSSASPKIYDAKALAVAVGNGAIDDDALAVAPADASGTIIVTVTVALSAGDYRGVAWQLSGLPAGTDARLLWRSEFKPGRTFTLAIPMEADRLAPVVAARDPNWIGPLNGIALALRLPAAATVRVSGVTLDPLTLRSQLAGRLRDWTTFEAWSGASINTVVGGVDLQELPLPVLLGLAAMLAAAAAIALARWRPQWMGAGLPLALAVMFVAAWLVLDARWQWNLARQVVLTGRTYAGLDWREKHVAAEDGPLFEFIEKVRAKLLPAEARVFMFADAHYFRGRGAYHLYPHNVFFNPWTNSLPPAATLRPGDYVVVYQRRGVQFDPALGMLRWDGSAPIAAEALVVEPGAALFRVR
jgi:hypothetical protein